MIPMWQLYISFLFKGSFSNFKNSLSAVQRCYSTDPGTTNFGFKEVKLEEKQKEGFFLF